MSRSDGKYPKRKMLAIDANKWPNNYWDSVLYCQPCDIRWPSSSYFKHCLDCGEKTTKSPGMAPEMRWPEAVKRVLGKEFEEFYEEWNEGSTDDQLKDPIETKTDDQLCHH